MRKQTRAKETRGGSPFPCPASIGQPKTVPLNPRDGAAIQADSAGLQLNPPPVNPGTSRCPYHNVPLDAPVSSPEVIPLEAEVWIRQFYEENDRSAGLDERIAEVVSELESCGSYHQRLDELTYGAKVAWRNSVRCVGRLFWRTLWVRDCRDLRSADEIFTALIEHLRITTNKGKILPLITVFAPATIRGPSVRIWNQQLVSYAGYRTSDGTIIGDPLHVEFTELVQSLGWKRPEPTPFDLLPIVIEVAGERPRWFEIPQGTVLEVPIEHPDFPWFKELGLRWYATPVISNMRLDIGGVSYPAAPFGGWYVSSEIGARDLADVKRYNLLPTMANRMGLDTGSERTLWKDRAFVELNRAVLYSFEKAGVRMTDHHTITQEFLRHEALEAKAGRSTYADWSWIIPPISGATTPVFHRLFENRVLKPGFFYQPAAWSTYSRPEVTPCSLREIIPTESAVPIPMMCDHMEAQATH